MQKKPIVVANWKMYMPYNTLIEYCQSNRSQFDNLGNRATIICCPSATALHATATIFKGTSVYVGAQNCSEYSEGAHTGQESASTLAQINCSYCIIGHSECRTELHETNNAIAKKLARLLDVGVCPIICIGETQQEYASGATLEVLRAQLEPIFATMAQYKPLVPVCIAYEPVWAIGSGLVPTHEQLSTIFAWITQQCAALVPSVTCHLLYGGSVNTHNVQELQTVNGIDGFLIGGASLDFQNFKKIVSLL